jgi:glyoxylase I family protein
MPSLKVHHISLNVSDAEEATRFYIDIMGMTSLPRPDLGFPGAWLSMGEQQLHLLQVDDHHAPVGQHFAFMVDDIHAAKSEIEQQGVSVSEPRELSGVCLQCFFKDPSDNLLELNQPL